MHNIQVEINPWLKILLDDFLEESSFAKKEGKTSATLRLNPAGPVTLVQEGMKCLAAFDDNRVSQGRVSKISRNNGTTVVELSFLKRRGSS
jgi:hypothetical protein